MTREEFAKLLSDFTHSAETGDGARFARHFAEDGVYHDYIYGPHTGRADIAHMMQDLFHRDAADYRWEMFDPVFDGIKGYAWSLSSFTSKIEQFKGQRVVIDGMSRFIVSAEDSARLPDLKPFIRDLLGQMERDLDTKLDWVAVDHFNTGHPTPTLSSAAAASMAWRTSRSIIGVHAFMRSGRCSVMVAIFSLTS